MPVPYILWPDEDRLLIDLVAELVRENGFYVLLDIPGVREILVCWFKDEIRERYQASQLPR